MPVFAVAYDNHCFRAYKKVSHLPSQLGIFVFTCTVKRFHIYGALLHLALKVFTFTWPYYIFTFRGATMVSQIYPLELQLNKANTSDTEAAFLDLHLSISNDIVLPKFMINVTTLILKLSISHFLMVMFLALHPMASISLN